jgi:hypothetical protein
MSSQPFAIFTIDVKPTVVFEAKNLGEARELARENWFRGDLSARTAGGVPLSTATSKLRTRFAMPDEIASFRKHRAALDHEPQDLELVYLSALDD